jgi:hypothetical protein
MTMALVFGTAAWADDVEGKIQTVDPQERMVVLEDGKQLWVAEGLNIEALKEGAKVKASYEERDGKAVVTSIEIVE